MSEPRRGRLSGQAVRLVVDSTGLVEKLPPWQARSPRPSWQFSPEPGDRVGRGNASGRVKVLPSPAEDADVTIDRWGSAPEATGVALQVLYVEDHPSNVRLLERLLARRGDVRLQVARTGQEGLRQAAASRPDVVLLDLHLPDLPGEEISWVSPLSRCG